VDARADDQEIEWLRGKLREVASHIS
jgi:hypothetical protein